MPPKVKVNVISEPSEDNVSYDAIVEASNVKQEEDNLPQLLDNEEGVNTSQETHADDVEVVKKARPKRSPKKKAVTVGEASQLRYIDQFNTIECCIPTAKEEQPKEEQPKEDDLLGRNPSEHGVRHEEEPKEEQPKEDEQPKKNVKIVELKECENAVRNLQLEHSSIRTLPYVLQVKISLLLKVVRKKRLLHLMVLNHNKLLDLERDKKNLISCLLVQFNILYLII